MASLKRTAARRGLRTPRLPWLLLAAAILLGLLHSKILFAAPQSVAFYYGADTRLDELHAFDTVVVDPDQGFDPAVFAKSGGELYAYVSVGEVQPSRAWAGEVAKDWLLGTNAAWQSMVLDQRNPAWRAFLIDRVVAPLWAQGYRGFFLDTLDSYRLGGEAAAPEAQQAGLVLLIKAMHARFPGIRLITNRGFELLPEIGSELEAVAAESLYRSWDQASSQYRAVPQQDRDWLLAQLQEAKTHYGLPGIVIDYVSPNDRALMRDTARRISADGFIPWVSSGGLNTLGMGTVEVLPRRILVVFNGSEAPGMHYRAPHLYAEMLLNYLGYIADYIDANAPLPTPDPGLYAGIVSWFDRSLPTVASSRYARWLAERARQGWRIALFDTPGFIASNETLAPLGLRMAPMPSGRISILSRHKAIGYETEPLPNRWSMLPVRLAPDQGTSWLSLSDEKGNRYDGVGITSWGGFAWKPFTVEGDDDNGRRWGLDPWQFLQQALALEPLPVPDTTSDAGRRMFFAHMDADGFASRAEFPGSPYAAQVLVDQVLKKYPTVPHTISIIEGEISPQGLYPEDSPALETIARQMFAQPNVEIATHTYSHPFRWAKVEAGDNSEDADADYHLAIPGYVPSLKREVDDSADYIRQRLAPPGKPVSILLWSGDAAPTPSALAYVENTGLLNMNGGKTMPTRAHPSLTGISALGARLGKHFQVFAPVTNENVYTNLWRGPFYGFRQVSETFELTGAPRRIKPVDIYFHTYSASKPSALHALQSAYEWALARPMHPVFASRFIRIAQSFNHVVLSRDIDGRFRVRNAGALRSLRLPNSLGEPDLASSKGLAGWSEGPDGRYLILTAAEASFDLSATEQTLAYLAGANAEVKEWKRNDSRIQARLEGFAPIEFDLARAKTCTVRAGSRTLTGAPVGALLRYRLADASATLNIGCR